MKKILNNKINILLLLSFVSLCFWPCLYYSEIQLENEQKIFNEEQRSFEVYENRRISLVKDSLYNVWISTNDTNIAKIKKIVKKPRTTDTGYWKKTEKYKCSKTWKDDYLCEPIKEWVQTGTTVLFYYNDTVYTDGYKNRQEWITKAEIWSDTISKTLKKNFDKTYPRHSYFTKKMYRHWYRKSCPYPERGCTESSEFILTPISIWFICGIISIILFPAIICLKIKDYLLVVTKK